jgi:uncharacterized RmlC-like cupin family protein
MSTTEPEVLEPYEPTPEEMEKRIARFKNLTPTKKHYNPVNVGIPGEAYAKVAADCVYKLMAPHGNKRKTAIPAVYGEPGVEVSILDNPPGHGPRMHAHMKTIECFLCLTGRYRISWGLGGKHSVELEPFDFIALPPRVFREVTNISDSNALIVAIVQGSLQDTFNDVLTDPAIGDRIRSEYGEEVHQNFKNVGIQFGTVWKANA